MTPDRRTFICGGIAALAAGRPAWAEIEKAIASVGRRASRPLILLAPEGCGANLEPALERFEALSGTPVYLRTVALDGLISTIMLSSIAGRADFDVALPPTFGIPDLAEAGMIRPLDDLVARLEPEGFHDGLLCGQGSSFDGRFYGYQTDGDAYLLFFNRRLSDADGVRATYADRHGRALDIPDTWAEFDRQAAFFHDPENGTFGSTLFRSTAYLGWEWWCRLHAAGVWPFAPDMTPQIDGAAGVGALEDMIRSNAHVVADGEGLTENWKRYAKGDVFANIGWGGTQKYLAGVEGGMRGQLAHAMLPGAGTGPMTYFNWGWTYVVSRHSDMPELAYLLSLLATSPEISTQSVRAPGGFFDPFRTEHYTDREIRAIYSDPFLALHRKAMSAAIPDLYVARRGAYMNALSLWLGRALEGRADPAFALGRVAQEWEFATERAGREAQSRRWQSLRASYPEAIRAALRDDPA